MHQQNRNTLKFFLILISIYAIYSFQNAIFSEPKTISNIEESINQNIFLDLDKDKEEENKFINDSIFPFCQGIKFQSLKALDINDIKYIDVQINNRNNWFENLFNLTFKNERYIDPVYKKTYDSKITTHFVNGFACESDAKIRISGDWMDHVNENKFIASMDVNLQTNNIFGIKRFKLFLPGTRAGDNEIIATTILEELGFISPRTFYINVGMKDYFNKYKINKYIFQEKFSKEMIEFNGFREGPLLETNEQFYWEDIFEGKNKNEEHRSLMVAKVLNNYWSKKNNSSSSITIEGIEKFNRAIFYSYRPDLQLNYRHLGENQDLLYSFDAANFALSAIHGITTHQRKFYFNKLENQFYPIYYDGNAGLKDLNQIIYRNDYLEKSKLSIAANDLLEKEEIDELSFYTKLNNRGVIINKSESDSLLNKFRENLASIGLISNSDSIPKYKSFNENNGTISYPDNFHYFFFKTNQNILEKCNFDLTNCNKIQDFSNVEELFSDKLLINNNSGILLGVSKDSFLQNFDSYLVESKEYKNFLIETYNKPLINLDQKNKVMSVEITDQNQKIKILGPGILENWTINVNGITSENKNFERFDENLLTGCLTLYNLHLKNVTINTNNMGCEDAVNIIRSHGTIEVLEINQSSFDGVDLDFSNLKIRNVKINNAGNDCIDLSSGKYIINEINVQNCNDKGISIGENSISEMTNISINNSEFGIAIKDSSEMKSENVKVENSILCISIYRKKQEFGPSYAWIKNLECNIESSNFIQKGSEFKIGK